MFEQSSLLLFITATIGFVLIPGPTVLYIVARSVEQGHQQDLPLWEPCSCMA